MPDDADESKRQVAALFAMMRIPLRCDCGRMLGETEVGCELCRVHRRTAAEQETPDA